MKPGDAMAVLNGLEQRLPVDQWRFRSLAIWPLVRLRLWWLLTSDPVDDSHGLTRYRSVAGSIVSRAVGVARREVLRVADRAHEASPNSQVDVLMFSGGVDRVLVHGVWYDRFFDVLVAALTDRRLRSLVLEPHYEYRRPRNTPSWPVQPMLDAVAARARLARPDLGALDVDGFSEVADVLGALGYGTTAVSAKSIAREALHVVLVSEFFHRVIDRTGPQLAFSVDYSPTCLAFHAACRSRGVPSVDIQHGVHGEDHAAYTRWDRVPPGGYALLPNVFWSWSDTDSAVINRWARQTGSAHSAVTGGNLWLDVWREGRAPFVREYDATVARLWPRTTRTRVVLVTLQSATAEDVVSVVSEAASMGPPEWRWIVRAHPTMSEKELAAVRREFRHVNAMSVDFEHARRLPLYALLRHVDAHVTGYSSTVIEAAVFGVPSIVLDDQALALFSQEIAAGMAVFASTPDRVVHEVSNASRIVATATATATATANVDAVLDAAFAVGTRESRRSGQT